MSDAPRFNQGKPLTPFLWSAKAQDGSSYLVLESIGNDGSVVLAISSVEGRLGIRISAEDVRTLAEQLLPAPASSDDPFVGLEMARRAQEDAASPGLAHSDRPRFVVALWNPASGVVRWREYGTEAFILDNLRQTWAGGFDDMAPSATVAEVRARIASKTGLPSDAIAVHAHGRASVPVPSPVRLGFSVALSDDKAQEVTEAVGKAFPELTDLWGSPTRRLTNNEHTEFVAGLTGHMREAACGQGLPSIADRARAADQLNTGAPNDCAGSTACDHAAGLCGAVGSSGEG